MLLRHRARRAAVGPAVAILAAVSGVVSPCDVLAQDSKSGSQESLLFADIPSVFGASRFDQAVTEAPASVSVITANEIAAYGWVTLSDLLRSVRGFYVTNDRSYHLLGTRGFSRPGDYNSRVLLLIDGIRVNENVFGAALIGTESLVDLATVDRVEVIRGPASSLYGTNAFFGIINVITQRGRARSGVQLAAEVGSQGGRGATVTAGGRTRRGIEMLGSVSRRSTAGQSLRFSEFAVPGGPDGTISNRDGEQRDRLFGKLEWGPLALEGIVNLRDRNVPTAPYGSDFNLEPMTVTDESQSYAIRYQQVPVGGTSFAASVSLSQYDFNARIPLSGVMFDQHAHGRWVIGEAQYTRTVMQQHRLVVGASYTHSQRLDESLDMEAGESQLLFDNGGDHTKAAFALAEVRLGERLLLNGGVRFDHTPSHGHNWSPRGALIFKTGESSALKLLYGNAFRAPNSFERSYDDGMSQKANEALTPERVSTSELLLEQLVSRHVKLTASVYHYEARQLIDIAGDPVDHMLQYHNIGVVSGSGIETEAELDLGRLTGRASYALQRASNPDGTGDLSNSPQHLGAFNMTVPLVRDHLRAGLEVRAMSERRTPNNEVVGGHVVTNINFSTRTLTRSIDASFGVFNVFDTAFSDPVGHQLRQRAIRQDGRTLRLAVAYAF